MIEVNLIPDVKQELIKAQRQRTTVISGAILVSLIAVGLVAVLAFYVFAVQGVRSTMADSDIATKSKKLKSVSHLSNALTVQNQLNNINSTYTQTNMDSRTFDVLNAVVAGNTSKVNVTSTSIDASSKTITLEGQTTDGYSALETFKKTILATQFAYKTSDATQAKKCDKKISIDKYCVPLTMQINDGDRSLGKDTNNKTVLTFTISFVYPDELFSRSSLEGQVVGPKNTTNATDSAQSVPSSLFGTKQGGTQ